MSVHFAEWAIDHRHATEPQYMARLRFELFVYWHRASKNAVDPSQHYLIGKCGTYPRESLRLTRVASIREVEWEPTMQPIARDEVAQYAEVMRRWEMSRINPGVQPRKEDVEVAFENITNAFLRYADRQKP